MKKKAKWQCTYCDFESYKKLDFDDCRKKNHEIMYIPGDDEEKTHTEYAKEIMKEIDFVTIKDSQETLFYQNGVYKLGAEVIVNAECEERIQDCTSYMRREVFKAIQARTYVDRSEFDNNNLILNVKNGLFDLESGKLKPHSPRFFSRNQLPVVYDPNSGPKKFVKFMRECLPNRIDREIIYEFSASILLRDAVRLEKILMSVGPGANGKSTFLSVLESVIGKENISNISIHDLLYNRFAKSQLDGKLANIHPDISNDELSRVGILKAIVSGDPIYVEKKGRDGFKMKNYSKLIYSCNQLPEINEDTDAVFRRFLIIEWPIQFFGKEDNKNLIYELTSEEELSGVLNLLIHKAQKVLHQNRLTYDQSTEQLRIEWKEKADPVQLFVNENIRHDELSIITKNDIYQKYVKWCTDRKLIPKIDRQFTTKMKSLGFKDDSQRIRNETLDPRGKTARIWKSVTFVTPLRESLPSKQIENDKKTISIEVKDKCDTVTRVTKKQYLCSDCNAGPFFADEESKASGNIVEFHRKLGHKVIEYEGGEESFQ